MSDRSSKGCSTHQAFKADALAVLDTMKAGRADDAKAAALALKATYGHGAISSALVVWCDALLSQIPRHDRRNMRSSAMHSIWMEAVTVEQMWAVSLIAARARQDKAAAQKLRAGPRGSAAIEAHVMALLAITATHINRLQDAANNTR